LLAAVVTGDEGRGHLERSDGYMRQHLVRDPDRMTATLAPGFE